VLILHVLSAMLSQNQNQDGDARLDRGRQVFGRAVRAIMIRNGLSHDQFCRFSQWACPWGLDWFSKSQLSYLRRGKMQGPGAKLVDAMGQVNLRLAQLSGDDGPEVDALPPLPAPPREFIEKLDHPFYLRHPQTGLAMTAGDLYMVWLGRMVPRDLALDPFTSAQAAQLSEAISVAAQRWAAAQGLLLTHAMPKLLEIYGISDGVRQSKLRSVIFGMAAYSPQELMDEVEALAGLADGIAGDQTSGSRELRALLAQGEDD
jgi:hypothetical protein